MGFSELRVQDLLCRFEEDQYLGEGVSRIRSAEQIQINKFGVTIVDCGCEGCTIGQFSRSVGDPRPSTAEVRW